jgi:ABC-type uncharacterized transport system substrate-binding protein
MLVPLRLLLCGLWVGLFSAVAVHATTIVIVSSELSPAYAEAAEALVGELERRGLPRQETLQITLAELPAAGPLVPKLFVTLGTDAANVFAKGTPTAPVLCALLPRHSFEQALLKSGQKSSSLLSALYLDQPLARQLDLIHLALPKALRIGVLWGPESQVQAESLNAQAKARGLELVEANVATGQVLFHGLKRVLEDADVLLAVPDPQVYNSHNIQNILLTSFRAKVPLVAFSPAYVRAGALLALHVTPAQVGLQAATLARGVLQGKPLPSTPQYSQDFSVAINEHVAHSLGLTLNADELREQMRRVGSAP